MHSIVLAGVILAASITVWTDPVLVAIERYGRARLATYGGALPGIVVDNIEDNITLTLITDAGMSQFEDATTSEAACIVDTTWLCENRTEVQSVDVDDVAVWSMPGASFCAARCRPNNATYAFIAVIGY